MRKSNNFLARTPKELIESVGAGQPGSPVEYMRMMVLNYKLQCRLIFATWALVAVTLGLAIATIVLAVSS